MSWQVRPTTTLDEFAHALAAIEHYFGDGFDLEEAERFGKLLPLERMHAALDGERIVGGAGALPFELTVPGGAVACAGVTVVGVLPTHRRQGVLTALMREQLEDVQRRGEPVAALWASEEAIYRRYGYGLASLGGEIEVPRAHTALRIPAAPGHTLRLVSLEEALQIVPPIYDRVRARTPGMMSRTTAWWETRRLDDPKERRESGAVKNVVVLERDGVPAAYALYRVVTKFEQGTNVGYLRVLEALGEEGTEVDLWRFLLELDWVASIRAMIPVDHPLLHALVFPRRMKLRLADVLWVRLVDVGTALAARTYGEGEPVVVELADAFLPENAGRWRISAAGVERTEDEADLALDVGELGSLYLGAFTATEFVRAGLVQELTEGAAYRADPVFRAARKPWCPEIF